MAEPMNRDPDAIDEVAWLRERVEAMTRPPWDFLPAAPRSSGSGGLVEGPDAYLFSTHDVPNGSGTVALRNLAPAMLAIIETAARLDAQMPFHDCRGPSCSLCVALPDVLATFRAAVREECAR